MVTVLRAGGVVLAVLLGLLVPAASAEPSGTEPAHPPGLTAREARLLAHDPSIDVSDDGTLYAVDEWHPSEADDASEDEALTPATAEALAATAATDVFKLHSRPTATRKIYLDFDGGSLLGINSWLLEGLTTLLFGGWSLDSSPSFSATEQNVIREVWARVAEDFSPWDVDVTTEEPAAGGLWRASRNDVYYGARVAFTKDPLVQLQLCSSNCGGVAWIGTFDAITSGETRSPAWVFPSSLGDRAKSMADAASHEAGHTLGLSHDGAGGAGYYSGNALWGPLMGSPYSASITQWSRGSYPGASNTEDDLSVMTSHGLPLRRDEAGSSPATAAALSVLPEGHGVISTSTDTDWFAVTDCGGRITASAVPAAIGPNLDIVLELRDASGAVLTRSAPPTYRTPMGTVNGLGAGFSSSVGGGTYYLVVSGDGSGTSWSAGGYDAYGSVGTYQLAVSGCASGTGAPVVPIDDLPSVPAGGPDVVPDPDWWDDHGLPPTSRPGRPAIPVVGKGPRGGKRTVEIDWIRPGGGAVNGYRVRALKIDGRGRVRARKKTAVLSGSLTGVSLVLPKGKWVVQLRARNELGWGPFSARSARVKAR